MAPRNDATLAFERIEVRKAPGIHPGYTIDTLSPDINIVFGPNASGKSTTARAIQALLWPHPSTLRRHELAASFRLGDDRWTIDADPGRTRRTRNGEPADPPLLAPIDDRLRYTLGLPDLLASENQPLAQAVFKESTGGFDLEAIRRDRGYLASPPARLEAARDVETAQLRVRDSERAASEVAAQQRQLATIRDRERQARQAHSDAENFRRALRFAHARHELERATAAMGQFAPALARLTGSEPDELAGMARDRDQLDARRAKLETDLAGAEADRKRTGLVDKEISESLIRTLRGQVEGIERLDAEITKLQRDVQGAIAERDSHRARLAADMSEQQLSKLDTTGLRELATLSHDYADLRTQRQAREELERWLGDTEAPDPGAIDELQRGIGLLVDRLRTPSADELDDLLARTRVAAVIGGGLVIAAAIWLGIFVHEAWFLLAILGLLILLYTWRYAAPASAVEAVRLEQQYGALELPQPRQWDLAGVRALLGDLEDTLRGKLVDQEKASRWQDLETHRAELAQREAEVDARRDNLVAQYGVAPDLGEESLRLLAENLSRWQAADGSVRAMQANLNAVGQERRSVEARLRDQLARFGYANGAFGANIDELEERLAFYSEATARATAARRELDGQVRPELQRLDGARAATFRRLDLADGDTRGLDGLIAQRETWRAAVGEQANREQEARAAEEALSLVPELKETDPEVLQRNLEAAETAAADLEPAMQEISEIRTRVGDAKRRRDQEDALLRRDNALQALRDEREEVERRIAGDTLLGFVREQTRDAALPLVFHRARELFTIVTRGRYELQFEEGPPPAFTARDTATGHTLALDQLSSGTRVQLLMAIRLAFVENVERGPKLPILLDETLGNSDELRAGAIIDAAIEISRNGRQVFYFTAQGEEVARWQARLDQIPVHERPRVAIVDLAEVRQDAGIERLPIQQPEQVIGRVPAPEPNGQGRAEYGAALRVPGVDPWAETLGGVHLWHAVTDPEALHRLVSQDLRTWGQLAGLAQAGSGSSLALMGVDDDLYQRAEARMRALGAALETWRIGRVRPVTNGDLAESGEVPAPAMPAVADLLAEAGGDGETLVTLLQDRSIAGVDPGAVDRLETWLLDRGFITTAAPLGRDEIRRRVLASASADLDAGRLAVGDIDELLGQLPEG
jgi:hypothetical protein